MMGTAASVLTEGRMIFLIPLPVGAKEEGSYIGAHAAGLVLIP